MLEDVTPPTEHPPEHESLSPQEQAKIVATVPDLIEQFVGTNAASGGQVSII